MDVIAWIVLGRRARLLLRSESFALRAGRALQRMVAVACQLARRPVPVGADNDVTAADLVFALLSAAR